MAGADTYSGGAGADVFFGTSADLNGDTVADFSTADEIADAGIRFGASALSLSPAAGGLVLRAPGFRITLVSRISIGVQKLMRAGDCRGWRGRG
jgi:hypothetical protein